MKLLKTEAPIKLKFLFYLDICRIATKKRTIKGNMDTWRNLKTLLAVAGGNGNK